MAALIFKLNKSVTTAATDQKLVPMKYGKSIQCLSTVSGTGKIIILEHLMVYFKHCEEPQLPTNSSRLMDRPLVNSILLFMLWYHHFHSLICCNENATTTKTFSRGAVGKLAKQMSTAIFKAFCYLQDKLV